MQQHIVATFSFTSRVDNPLENNSFRIFSLFRKVLFYCSFIKCTMAHEVTGCFTGYADVQHLHLHNRGSCAPLGLLLNTDLDPPKQELSSSNTGDCWCMLAQRKRTKRFDDIYASRQIIFSNLILLFFYLWELRPRAACSVGVRATASLKLPFLASVASGGDQHAHNQIGLKLITTRPA